MKTTNSRSVQRQEVSTRERYPFACGWKCLALDHLQNSALAEFKGKQHLPSSLICSTELFANSLGRQREGAVSPANAIRREKHR